MFLAEATVEIFSGLQAGTDETDDEPEVLCAPNHDDIRGICLSPLDWQLAEECLLVWAKIRADAHRQTDKRTEEQAGRQADADRKKGHGDRGKESGAGLSCSWLRLRLRF